MNLLDANDKAGCYPPSFYAHDVSGLDDCAPAKGDIKCDVCVVGGGFTGTSAALHLAKRGYKVHLLEAQRIGFGASGRNGGQVGQGQRRDQIELEQMFGETRARELWKIGTQAVALVRELAASAHVHANFHPGILHVNHKARYTRSSREYVDHMHSRYGYEDIKFIPPGELNNLVNSPAYHSGTLDIQSGHIHPLQLVLGIGRMAQAQGAVLHENTRVNSITRGATVTVATDTATVKANHLILACNGYIGDLNDDVSRHVMPINNFIVATEPLEPNAQENIIRGNLAVADSKFVVNYFRFSDDHRLLFGGTESYGYRFPKDIAANVRKAMINIFPQLKEARIDYAWGGTLGITMKRLPHFNCYDGNILSLSGFSGLGVALGTLSGQIAAETIAGQSERFDIMCEIQTPAFPGGERMRHPLLILAMLWYSLMDRL